MQREEVHIRKCSSPRTLERELQHWESESIGMGFRQNLAFGMGFPQGSRPQFQGSRYLMEGIHYAQVVDG